MPSPGSNPTRRVVLVLDYLAEHPGRFIGLSDLARAVGISKSTLHPIIETLVEVGYLLRDEDSRMVQLGPTLTGVGQAALGSRARMIDALRPLMDEFAQQLDAHCLISAAFGGWIVPLAVSGNPSRVTTLFRVGARSNPLEPPMGSLFMAGSPMATIQDWIKNAGPDISASEVETALSSVDLVRSQGFAAAVRLDAKARLEQALDGFLVGEASRSAAVEGLIGEMRRATYLLTDFNDPTLHEIDWIGIPVDDKVSGTRIALVILNLPAPLTGHAVQEVAQSLRTRVSAATGVQLLPA